MTFKQLLFRPPIPIITWRCTRHRRRGMLMFVNMAVVLLMVLLFAFLLNSGKMVKRKTEAQQRADAIAFSCGLQKTRALNAISGANHIIGEVLAHITLHHALGGDLLDLEKNAEEHAPLGQRKRLKRLNEELDIAYESYKQASRGEGRTPAYETVRQKSGIKAQATLLRAKMNLKEYLIWIYQTKAAAREMQAYPPTYSAGVVLEQSMHNFEREILAEYEQLKQIHARAVELLPLKFKLRDCVLPEIKAYTRDVVMSTPQAIRELADSLGKKYGVSKAYVLDPNVPVILDPLAKATSLPPVQAIAEEPAAPHCDCKSVESEITRKQIVKVTQLVRSTFPWVVYHRLPVWESLKQLAPLSKAEKYYVEYTAGYTRDLCDRYQTDEHDLGLYVIQGYPAPDKGYELWTQSRSEADRTFGTLVVIHLNPDSVIGSPAVFQQHFPSGQVFYAEALSYNANPEKRHACRINLRCKRITPNRQANVGYDTLQWQASGKSESGSSKSPWELVAKTDAGGQPDPEFPRIRLNWQAKLVETSAEQLAALKLAEDIPVEMRSLVDKLLDRVPGALLSH